jgi:hypothetical protein
MNYYGAKFKMGLAFDRCAPFLWLILTSRPRLTLELKQQLLFDFAPSK